jgi:formylglycine-generating enzyme required for sulfatase activity/tRNA A-37 threonylcarbamoyl transferase component Bud32
MSELTPGFELGPYRILRLLGRGGMGEVYLAEHKQAGWKRALKVLPAELAQRIDFVQRFKREAAVLDSLQHPHIVRVREMAEAEGLYYLVMDFIQGGGDVPVTLGDHVERAGGRLNPPELVRLLIQVCGAVGYAHSKGIIHRDLKPGNILLNDEGDAIVSDFGLARVVGQEFLQSRIAQSVALSRSIGDARTLAGQNPLVTAAHSLLGTWDYMSPEVKNGQVATVQSDIYAIGVMYYRCLTGADRLSFERPRELVAGLSEEWDTVYERTGASQPENRYASCAELAAGLAACLAPKRKPLPEAVPPPEEPEAPLKRVGASEIPAEPEPKTGRKRFLLALIGFLMLIPVISILTFLRPNPQEAGKPIPPVVTQKEPPPAQLANVQSLPTITNSIGMKLVLIPAGEFQMGSEKGESNEKPVHEVQIEKPFYLGETEVTQGQWEAVMGSNPSHFKGPDLPVEQVSWEDSQEFLKKLSDKEGKSYRLPSEAEWEYACRAGSQTEYCFGDGDSNLGEYAWYDANSGGETHPVGQKKPNGWGLYDMHGNVREWCQDWSQSDFYSKSEATVPSPICNNSASRDRVVRGGGWDFGAWFCRSVRRSRYGPGARYTGGGVRVVLLASP